MSVGLKLEPRRQIAAKLSGVLLPSYDWSRRSRPGGIMHLTECGRRRGVLLFVFVLLICSQLFAGVTASISGTVKDASGASVAGAAVTATNTGTGIAQTQITNGQGFYSFQSLPLGKYTIEVHEKGFKAYRQTDLVLDVNSALLVDVNLQVGQATEKVEVSADALHVETVTAQMGEVIEGKIGRA